MRTGMCSTAVSLDFVKGQTLRLTRCQDWKWKFLFSQQVYTHVIDALLGAKAPTYETVLDLDRRIRQTTLPAVRLYLRPDEDDYTNPALCMKGYLMSQYRSISEYTT